MAGIKNKARAAVLAASFDEDENEDFPEGEDGFDVDDPTEFTDEDAAAEAEEFSEKQRDALQRSRKRGTAAHSEQRGHRGGHRGGEEREHKENEFVFRPLNSLDAPPPLPGMEQRWIRVLSGEKNDVRNWSRQSRHRWEPRLLSTVPKTFNPPIQQLAGIGEVIMVGDLILCQRDARYGRSRRKYYEAQHQKQVAATKRHVKKVERDDHPIKVIDRDAAPTVGRGRRVRAQDDE